MLEQTKISGSFRLVFFFEVLIFFHCNNFLIVIFPSKKTAYFIYTAIHYKISVITTFNFKTANSSW